MTTKFTRQQIERAKKEIFRPEILDKVTDEDVLGIMLARTLDWDDVSILQAAYFALEDSNFHDINETLVKTFPFAFSEGKWNPGAKKAESNPSSSRLDTFTKAYIEAALWAELDEEGQPLDENYDIEDIDPNTLKEMIADAKEFQAENSEDIGDRDTRAGHDFWLTRNGHGAGFWDGDWPKGPDDRLTESAKEFGEYNLYVGDDGMIYGSAG